MSLKDVRLDNLRLLLAEAGGKKTDLAKLIGKSPPQISQWFSGNRTITEDTAREIEASAKKPPGWLDQPHDQSPGASVAQVMSLSIHTVPSLTWEGLMDRQDDLPQEFAAPMPDDALPSTPRGTRLIFSTAVEPQFGQGVLVRVRGELHVRRYAQHAEGWCAQAAREGYESFRPSDGAVVLAAVVGRYDGQV